MDCFDAGILMLKELEGTSAERERDVLAAHLLTCPACMRHYKYLRNAVFGDENEKLQTRIPVDFEVQVMTKIRYVNAVTVVTTKVNKIK